MVLDIWKELHIEPTKDQRVIKKAYASRVKECHPEEFPEEYQRLRTAYEIALEYAKKKEEPLEEQVFIEIKEESDSSDEVEKIGRLVEEALSKEESTEQILPVNVPNKVEAGVKRHSERSNWRKKSWKLICVFLLILAAVGRVGRIKANLESLELRETTRKRINMEEFEKNITYQNRETRSLDQIMEKYGESATRGPVSVRDRIPDFEYQNAASLGKSRSMEDVQITCSKAETISADSETGQSGQLLAVSVQIENQREDSIYAIDTSNHTGEPTETPVLYVTLLSKDGTPYEQTEVISDSVSQLALWGEIEPGGIGEGLIYFQVTEEMLTEQGVVLKIYITKNKYATWGIDFNEM